jgi:nucleotidyltransferase substrate binding protein (TIGR01987 family)
MNNPDIRWIQRFDNYKKALSQLSKPLELSSSRTLNDIEKLSLVKAFELTFELAWNVMKDFLFMKGINGIIGSKDAIRQAFKVELITEGQTWMDMVDSRNEAAHSYDEKVADKIVKDISERYYNEFIVFSQKMETLKIE